MAGSFDHAIPETPDFVIAALYKFVSLRDIASWQEKLRQLTNQLGMAGTLLIAEEGLNGTVAGRYEAIGAFVNWLRATPEFADIEIKYALEESCPFHRMKVRLKREIVSMGREEVKPAEMTGTYVAPEDWNALISDPDVMVVDTRNDYEVAIGQFKGAVNPHTDSFRQFPDWAEALANLPDTERPKKLAMYCTGGIRCEKSTALMKQVGFDEVYHLKGGILKYFEEVEEADSLWEGECFVFDNRVAVDHGLNKGQYDMCHACRMPLSAKDMQSNAFQKGVSCPHCITKTSTEQRQRFAERQKQITLAKKRGQGHIGVNPRAARNAPIADESEER